jgi:hypothetical protein
MPSTTKVRRRNLSAPTSLRGKLTIDFQDSHQENSVSGPFVVQGTQVTESEGHSWPLVKGERRDIGGNFFTEKKYLISPKTGNFVSLKAATPLSPLYNFVQYDGSVWPVIPGFNSDTAAYFPTSGALTDDQLDELGTVAISRCKPGEPYRDLATSLTELLREGLPAIIGKEFWKNKTLSSLGKEYLGLQFGYNPIVTDVKKLARIANKTDKWISQFERDAGRRVRRGYGFPIDTSEFSYPVIENTIPDPLGSFVAFADSPNGSSYTQGYQGTTYVTSRTQRNVWFSGSFTYYLPEDWVSSSKLREKHAKFNQLLGLELTPETLWNVAPWSWMLDWFGNTGDVISNLNDFLSKHLVMHYGYVMCHTFVTNTYSWSYDSDFPNRPAIPEIVLCTETKQRREANPFGFGVSWDGLSPFQTSIATALGLSRKR